MGHEVRVRLFERTLEVWVDETLQVATERLRGRHGHRVDCRHVIWSLVRKPRAFARYRFREDLFPSLTFRRAYDHLCEQGHSTRIDLEYLRILFLAATTMQSDVEVALKLLLEAGSKISATSIKELVQPQVSHVPTLLAPEVDLTPYDLLLSAGGAPTAPVLAKYQAPCAKAAARVTVLNARGTRDSQGDRG